MDLPSVEKQTLRKKVQKDIDALTPAAREEENSALVARLTDWARLTGWEWVLATLPFPDEPNLVPFLAFWLASGHRVALARTGPGRSLDFGEVESMEGPWLPKPFGMREPPREARSWTPGLPTLVCVPGLAFAPGPGGASRLGRGAGYYDRWLATHSTEVFTLGVGWSVQSLDEVPLEPHDRPLDGWLDPRGFHGMVRG